MWLGNSRGQRYTEGAKTPYSLETMGDHDLPAMISKVLNVTHFNKLNYIGYDQGATQIITAMANNNTYFANKVDVVSAIAPCTY